MFLVGVGEDLSTTDLLRGVATCWDVITPDSCALRCFDVLGKGRDCSKAFGLASSWYKRD